MPAEFRNFTGSEDKKESGELGVKGGIVKKDEEDLRLQASAAFWRMIEERRREATVSLEDIKAELFADVEPRTNTSEERKKS